jgi:hypothetical protein
MTKYNEDSWWIFENAQDQTCLAADHEYSTKKKKQTKRKKMV